MAPTLSIRLMRHEQVLLSAEAALLSFFASALTSGTGEGHKDDGIAAHISREPVTENGMSMLDCVPRILKHSPDSRELAYPYSILSTMPPATAGDALSSAAMSLSVAERRSVDTQIGRLASELSTFTSPTQTFGPVPFVLSYSSTLARMSQETSEGAAQSSHAEAGSSSWAIALMSMLESVLRDGEDMSVLLPYELIRAHYRRLKWRLDEVRTPRLLVLNVEDACNVLLVRRPETHDVRVVGLRDWSHGVFGDPMLADCFQGASEGIWEGWRGGIGATEWTEGTGKGAAVRLQLYKVYNVIVRLITEFYRPQTGSSARELEARRMLRSALDALEKLDDGSSNIEGVK